MSALATPQRQGTSSKPDVKPSTPLPEAKKAAKPAPPPPVIPTAWLAPDEQRRLIVWVFGLVEVMKVWDVVAPHITGDLPTALSSATRLRGPWSAAVWFGVEMLAIAAVSLLRIPGLSPSPGKFALIAPLLVLLNVACWFLADPIAFVPKVSMFGPVHLGEEGFFWGWIYFLRHVLSRLVFGEPENISGTYSIRLLPYSTATLNPLSLTYCLPPGGNEPVFIPVVFNNSAPDQVSYYLRDLETGASELQNVPASQMKQPVGWSITLNDQDGDDDLDDTQPINELVKRNQLLDVARLHSVRPAESLSIIPPDLSASESLLYLTVSKPSVVQLHAVSDKRGDRFNIAPHREALIIECPAGGDFVNEDSKGKLIRHPSQTAAPLPRCIGSEDVVKFEARGVAPLKVAWKKLIGKTVIEQGVIEGIEDEVVTADAEQGHFRRDRASKTHIVPLRVSHQLAGDYTVVLTGVVDALGNTYTPSADSSTYRFTVMGERSISFLCNGPRELLVNGTVDVPFAIKGSESEPLDIRYSFKSSATGKTTERTIKLDDTLAIRATEPGQYRLLDVSGRCAGTVLEPSTCEVREVPPPSAEMSVTTLHECAMDVGINVAFEFTGSPPFHVRYNEQRKGGKLEIRTQRFDTPVGQIELRPEREGTYIYNFNFLSDARYKDLPLNRAPIEQVVHPPASVDIIGATRYQLFACSPDEFDINLGIMGNDPLHITYRKSWGTQSQNVTVPVKSGKFRLTVPVPEDLAAKSGNSGKLAVALISVEDANGCVKRLPTRLVEVDIDRHRPTVQFAKQDHVVIKEGDRKGVDVPLRLTGRGPWDIVYTLDGKEQPVIRTTSPNSPLNFKQKGKYQLVRVRDANCPGDADNGIFSVDFKPRPSASLIESAAVRKDGSVYRHKGLCAGEDDAVGVHFVGLSPFEVKYKYSVGSKASEHALKSAQEIGVLHLDSSPGRHKYQFTSVRDDIYENTPVDFTLEHDVHARPSATFVKQNTLTLCRDAALVTDAKVRLTGEAPFTLQLGVRKPASAEVVPHVVRVPTRDWKLEIPKETVAEVGRYEITILGIADAAGCEFVIEDSDVHATTLDVVETARVVSIDHKTDLCVGDTLDFLLQGKAPWIVEYEWQGRLNSVTSSAARFSRSADSEGVFAIRSVALKDRNGNAQCKRQVNGLERRVHALPSVRVQNGIDNLREGDQPAVFTITFTGTPPFTFTYTRSETVNGRPRIVETQTISDIFTNTYSISSSSPGDYSVTSVQDMFCRYPPLSRSRADV
ncbi:hypothetical protein VHUM_03231 [Vanrija humicola]|uniref:Uncharacterized protein n=1 Tax=Vanrija humicola TaxID=5417 RepID=A0A7D8UYG9_VANHU|nr:hypothetical protein VHUM_03231 [Vanrija humicola]